MLWFASSWTNAEYSATESFSHVHELMMLSMMSKFVDQHDMNIQDLQLYQVFIYYLWRDKITQTFYNLQQK